MILSNYCGRVPPMERGREKVMELSAILALAGGIALFLFGMNMMGEGLEQSAGNKLRKILEALTRNRILAVLVGMGVTAVIQSSGATTVMTVGFVNAGLMDLNQAVGVIMGANVGTTVTGQMIAVLDMGNIAPVILTIGVIVMLAVKKRRVKAIGQVFAGLGMLFMGMGAMTDAMAPLRENEAFCRLMTSFSNPLLGVLVGAVFTALIQSSSACTGIMQALAAQGLIGLESSMFILFGQNIGTCITAMISSVGTSRSARRTALIHLMFNTIGALVFVILGMTVPLADWVRAISPLGPMQEIANLHTAFNIVTTLMLLPLADWMVKITKLLVPGEDPKPEPMALVYIKDQEMVSPFLAVTKILRETQRLGELALRSLRAAVESFLKADGNLVSQVKELEDVIKFLSAQITAYLVRMHDLPLDEREAKVVGSLFHVVTHLERIGDHACHIAEYTRSQLEENVKFSDAAREEMQQVADMTAGLLEDALETFRRQEVSGEDQQRFQQGELAVDALSDQLREAHIQRLNEGLCTPRSGMDFVDMLINLERVADHASGIVRSVSGQN